MHLNTLGQSIIILCSARRTTDLLEKRSLISSDRPRAPMLVELMKYDNFFGFLPYDARWRRRRRLFYNHFHIDAVSKYFPFRDHTHHAFASTILDLAYGIKVQEKNDPYVEIVGASVAGFAEAGVPGAFLVDFIPILKYVPEWMPDAGFKRKAARWRDVNYRMAEVPWRLVESQHSQGTAPDSVSTALLDELPPSGTSDGRRRRSMPVTLLRLPSLVWGADTVRRPHLSSVQAFFMAMALYPDAQRKAQAELDSVVGNNRLPDFADRDSLPYVNAITKEVMRWHNIAPLGFPHMTTADDEYDGYFIPKGSTIIGNTWSILHNPETYDEPLEFRPERFLKDGEIDPRVWGAEAIVFGYGRRIYPGRHFADSSLFSVVSSVLSVFTISHAKDEHGKTIPIHPGQRAGFCRESTNIDACSTFEFVVGSYPVHFDCEIKPRSAAAEKLIRDSQD
ncbi:cytochrome P450 [Infundibulicybe gibba]|nr:cytochrome P450 [Infundibulicybe gibba]